MKSEEEVVNERQKNLQVGELFRRRTERESKRERESEQKTERETERERERETRT
jgi:hypothetical protein